MKDRIDDRNFREKCARSIVKSYNVRYVTQEELDAQKAAEQEAVLQQEQSEKVIETAFEADERYAHVPSSQYGTTSVEDPVTKEQIEKILGERKNTNVFEEMKKIQ